MYIYIYFSSWNFFNFFAFDTQSLVYVFQTHPSQSCFMSSIDLHTQYSYQVLNEIWGAFCL